MRGFSLSLKIFSFVILGFSLGCTGGGTPSNNSSLSLPNPAPTASPMPIPEQEVHFQSDGLNLVGYLFKPEGSGPFPAIIWNHGSEQNPDKGPEFPGIASVFVPAGYVVLAPVRRGQGTSEGQYISDAIEEYGQTHTKEEKQQFFVDQMSGPQLDDQLAGLAYLKSLPYVDQNKIAVVGCSYGGIQTLLGAEHPNTGYKSAVAMCPGAESWGDPLLQQRLLTATQGINIPVFLLHPNKDASTEPGYVLGQSFQKLQKSYSLKIFPPFGPEAEQGHCFGGAQGNHVWAPDVLKFLHETLN